MHILYIGQEAIVWTEYSEVDWLQVDKGVRQGCMVSPYLNVEYLLRDPRLEALWRKKCYYADDTTLIVIINKSSNNTSEGAQ